MNRRASAAVVVVLLVLAAGIALVGGLSADSILPAPGDDPADSADSDASGATTAADARATSQTTATAGEDAGYDFTIQRVESCGTTCRNVTARLANEGSEAREDVRVTTSLYADGDLLWRGNETVGRLDAGEAHTSTKRVELGFAGGGAIQRNGGYVTIVTVVASDDGTTRFSERRKVA